MKADRIPSSLANLITCVGWICLLAATATAQDFGSRREAEPDPDVHLKVYTLQYANSGAMLGILRTLFDHSQIRMAADKRTNSLIVQGPPDTLNVMSALVAKLDEPTSRSSAGATRTQRSPSDRKPSDRKPVGRNQAPAANRSANRVELRNDVPGESTVQMIVSDGTEVKKGDLLVELDSSQLLAEKEQLQMELENAKSELAQAELALVNQTLDVDVLEAEVQIAKLRREQAQAEVKMELQVVEAEIALAEQALETAKRREALLKSQSQSGTASSMRAADANMAVHKAQTQIEIARAKHSLLRDHTTRLRNAELELETRQAELQMERAKRELAANQAQVKARIGAVRAGYALTAARLQRVVESVTKCKIHSPQSGTARRAASRVGTRQPMLQEGATVRQGQRLLELELEPDKPRAKAKDQTPATDQK